MVTVTIIEAVRRATDPFGMEGTRTASMRPTAAEVIDRLEQQGYSVVSTESVQWLLDKLNEKGISTEREEPLSGIEQYQVESR